MTMQMQSASGEAQRYRLSTDEFAAQFLVAPQTVRKLYSATGSYHGVKPVRLPNRKLLWPADAVTKILAEQLRVEA
jgi:hypothetical protein